MYSDDTKVYNSVEAEDKHHKLQDDFDNLVDWADTWQLQNDLHFTGASCHYRAVLLFLALAQGSAVILLAQTCSIKVQTINYENTN